MRIVRCAGLVALALLAVLMAAPGRALTATVPCTGNPSVDGNALLTVLESSSGDDTITLTAPCVYAVTSPVTVTGRTLTLTTGGVATLQAAGNQLLSVLADGRLNADHLALTAGDDSPAAGGEGLGGNLTVAGVLDLTDSTVSGGTGGKAGNLFVAGGGHATLVRTSLMTGTSDTVGARGAWVEGQLSLIDSLVEVVPSTGPDTPAIALVAGSAELFYDTVLAQSGSALQLSNGSAAVTGTVLEVAGPACTGGLTGVQAVGSNLASSDCGGLTVGDPKVSRVQSAGGLPYPVPDAGSPVVDAGDTAYCQNTTSAQGYYAGPSDLRGRDRVFGPACDLGAYESQSEVSYPAGAAFSSASPQKVLTITNTGTDQIQLGAPTVTGSSAFAVDGTTCGQTLDPQASCTVTVTYTPQDTTQTGVLRVADNASGDGHVDLTGEAAPPPAPPPAPAPSPTAAPTSAAPTPAPTAAPASAAPTTAPPTTPSPPAPTTSPAPTPGPTRVPPPPSPLPSRTPGPAPTRTAAPVPTRGTTSPLPVVLPTAGPSPSRSPAAVVPVPSPSGGPTRAVPVPRSPDTELGSWERRHADRAMPWFVRNVQAADEVDTSPGKIGRNLLLALLLLALLNLPINLINKALDEHGGDLAGLLAGAKRRLPDLSRLQRLPAPLRLVLAVVATSAISSGLAPGAGLDRQTAVTFAGLLVGVGIISTVATSVDDTWCERRLRVRATLTLFPGFWLLSLLCLVVSRLVGLHPGLVLGTLAGVSAARSLSRVEDGQRVLVVQVAVLALGAYSWVAYGPMAQHAERTHALHTEVLAAATGTVFVGVLGGSLLSLVPIGELEGAVLRRWSTPVWAAVTFVALFGFVGVLLRDDGSDPLLQHPGYLAALLGAYLLAAGAFLAFWRWFESSPRAAGLRARAEAA